MSNGPQANWEHLRLETFFREFDGVLRTSQKTEAERVRFHAPEFNVFDFITPSENILSDILAFLIDPDGSHGQSTSFLNILIARAGVHPPSPSQRVFVARESLTYTIANHRRRIDLLVTFPEFLLGIETKKYTGEGKNQIAEYCDHLCRASSDRYCLIFLTPTGQESVSINKERAAKLIQTGRLLTWCWEHDILDWLAECLTVCQAPKIQHFLKDFQSYIRTYLATNPPE